VEIRLETTLGLDVRVGHVVARYRPLPGYLANFGHDLAPVMQHNWGGAAPEKARFIPKPGAGIKPFRHLPANITPSRGG
jgi:hypothetical protein